MKTSMFRMAALLLAAALLVASAGSCRNDKPRPEDTYSSEARRLLPDASMVDSVSYLLGVQFAAMLHYGGGGSDGDDFGAIDMQRVKEGIDDFDKADADGQYLEFLRKGFEGPEYEAFIKGFDIDPALSEAVINRFLMARLSARGKDNEEKAAAFFSENRNKEGVREVSVRYAGPKGDSLTSFIQYQILTPGGERSVVEGDSLVLTFRSQRLFGRVFDHQDSLRVSAFADSLFLPGFSAALRELHFGDVAKVFVPAELAFGDGRNEEGRPFFSPYSALVFDLTVHEISDPDEEAEAETDEEDKEEDAVKEETIEEE